MVKNGREDVSFSRVQTPQTQNTTGREEQRNVGLSTQQFIHTEKTKWHELKLDGIIKLTGLQTQMCFQRILQKWKTVINSVNATTKGCDCVCAKRFYSMKYTVQYVSHWQQNRVSVSTAKTLHCIPGLQKCKGDCTSYEEKKLGKWKKLSNRNKRKEDIETKTGSHRHEYHLCRETANSCLMVEHFWIYTSHNINLILLYLYFYLYMNYLTATWRD